MLGREGFRLCSQQTVRVHPVKIDHNAISCHFGNCTARAMPSPSVGVGGEADPDADLPQLWHEALVEAAVDGCLQVAHARLPTGTLPLRVLDVHALRDLHVVNCGLRHLPVAIGALADLRSLNLNGNELRALPEEVCDLRALVTISVYVLQRRSACVAVGSQMLYVHVFHTSAGPLAALTTSSRTSRATLGCCCCWTSSTWPATAFDACRAPLATCAACGGCSCSTTSWRGCRAPLHTCHALPSTSRTTPFAGSRGRCAPCSSCRCYR